MEIFNVGPLELILILAVMIVFLGPKGMQELARQTGTMLRKARQSSTWKEIQRVMDETRDLPVRLVREAGFEEQMAEIRKETQISVDLSLPNEPEAHISGEGRSPGSRLRSPQPRGRRASPPQDPPSTDNDADIPTAVEAAVSTAKPAEAEDPQDNAEPGQ